MIEGSTPVDSGGNGSMTAENPLIALVKALARRRARLDAIAPTPANENLPRDEQARKQ